MSAALPVVQPEVPVQADTGKSKRGWSYYSNALRCMRLWAYRNVYSQPGERGGARGLGTLIHALLARHYLLLMGVPQPSVYAICEDARNYLTDRPPNRKTGQPGPTVNEQIDLAKDRYGRYVAMFNTDGWVPLSVEQEYAVGFLLHTDGEVYTVDSETPRSVLFTKRADLFVRDRDGRIWDTDHKSTFGITNATTMAYSMHGQFHGSWHIGWHHFGKDFAGPLINYVQTWKGPRFSRERPKAAPALVNGFPRQILSAASMIRLWAKTVGAVENPDGTYSPGTSKPHDWPAATHELVCSHRYGVCDHAAACRFGS